MRHACCGWTPRFFRRHAPRVVVVGMLLGLTACASEKTAQIPSAFGDSPPTYTAEAHPRRVETEADGLPSQPPPLRSSAVADDPREPWSPNYGTVAASSTAMLATPMPTPTPISAPARVAMVIKERFSIFDAQPVDEEDTIRRAIAAHEMRRED